MSHDMRINVNVTLAAPALAPAGLTTLMIVGDTMGAGFTELSRTYTSPSDVSDDEDLGAALEARLFSAYVQKRYPSQIKVGRLQGGTLEADLDAIAQTDNEFFAFVIDSRDKADILAAAQWAEINGKMFVAGTQDSDVLSATADNVAEELVDAGYENTMLVYHNVAGEYPEVAYAALQLNFDPDNNAVAWSNVDAKGISPVKATSTQATNLNAQRVNWFDSLRGVNVFTPGIMASGHFADHVVAKVWLRTRLESDLVNLLVRVNNLGQKISYTDKGIEQVASVVRSRLLLGEAIGHLAEGSSSVVPPKESDVPQATKVSRQLTIPFATRASGAVNSVSINGIIGLS